MTTRDKVSLTLIAIIAVAVITLAGAFQAKADETAGQCIAPDVFLESVNTGTAAARQAAGKEAPPTFTFVEKYTTKDALEHAMANLTSWVGDPPYKMGALYVIGAQDFPNLMLVFLDEHNCVRGSQLDTVEVIHKLLRTENKGLST